MIPAPVGNSALWLSLRPQFAESILEGRKTTELRRVRPQIPSGAFVVVYATTPLRALVGAFLLERIEEDEPERLWQKVRVTCDLRCDAYKSYFKGAKRAVGLQVGATWELEERIHLTEIRTVWPGFFPPQSFRYLTLERSGDVIRLSLPAQPSAHLLLESLVRGNA